MKKFFYIALNINGPTVMKVPRWVEDPISKYYLYFGHHDGQYIRLATAESPEGPFSIYRRGVLKEKKYTFIGRRHVASPDIWIDND
ncbi:MAG: hypothetical protein ACTSVI_12935, partial [Promethearchaeota archaeon]